MNNHPPILGMLEKVSLESIWPHEAQDFTPWLASPENLHILGDTLGLELEPEDQEVAVGPFSADILCKNTVDDSWVVIENQIKKTNHEHLGQILTYAAGLGAKTLVWIASHFTEEHRATLDWLNENTLDDVSFFGLEIELWRIGNSSAAPKFNIVSKPNDWSKVVRTQAGGNEGRITPLRQLQFEFWTAFNEWLDANTKLRAFKPGYRSWQGISLGRRFFLNAVTSTWNSITNIASCELRVELWLGSAQAKEQYATLESMKDSIQSRIDVPLSWRNSEQSKSAKIFVRCDADFTNRALWPQQFRWLATYLQKFVEVFGPIVKEL